MRERARELAGDLHWAQLVETLSSRRLLPVLGPRIIELADGRASEDFVVAVNEALDVGRRHSGFLLLVAQRVMSALTTAGIRSAQLKGPLLAEAIYRDLGRRLSNDIDLLVAPEQLHQAVDVVRTLGYAAPADYLDASGLPMLHFSLRHEREELPPLELHWRIHWYERSFARERLLPLTAGTPGDWRPRPADEFAALLLFYARDGFVDLRLATDLSAWWDAFGVDLAPGVLTELLREYPAQARAILVALKVSENTVGLPVGRLVRQTSRWGIRDRIAVRLANPNPRASRSQLYADTGFIDGLLTPPGGFAAFVRRKVLIPREVFEMYARNAPGGWSARSSLDYGLRVLARYGLTMLRSVRAPEMLR